LIRNGHIRIGHPVLSGTPVIRPVPSRFLCNTKNGKNGKNSKDSKDEITHMYHVGTYENHLLVLDSGRVNDVIQPGFGAQFSGPDAGTAYMESS
jgi:hypothetical protein